MKRLRVDNPEEKGYLTGVDNRLKVKFYWKTIVGDTSKGTENDVLDLSVVFPFYKYRCDF